MLNALTSLFLRLNKPLQFPKFKLVVNEMDPGGKRWRVKMRPLKVAADYFHILRVVCSWEVKVSPNICGNSHNIGRIYYQLVHKSFMESLKYH